MNIFILIIGTLLLSGCSMDLSLTSLLKRNPSIVEITPNLWINAINQNSFVLSGTCLSTITEFEVTSPFIATIPCVDNKWTYTTDLSSEDDGEVLLTTNLSDPNSTSLITLTVHKDTVPPSVQSLILNDANPLTNKTAVSYTLQGADIYESYGTSEAGCTSAGTWLTSTRGTTSVSIGDGVKTVYAKARDRAGNESLCLQASIELDQTPPVITNLQDDTTLKASKTWSWSCTDVNSPCLFRHLISQSSTAKPSASFSTTQSATQSSGDGVFYLTVEAQDKAGNISVVSRVSTQLSSTLPNIRIQNGATYFNNLNVQLQLANFSNYDTVELSEESGCLNATTRTPQTNLSWAFTSGEGLRYLYYRFLNTSTSDTSECYTASITLDLTPPTVTISSTAPSYTNTAPIPISVTFSKAVTGFTVADVSIQNATISNFTGSEANYSFNLTPILQGNVKTSIAAGSAVDNAGNENTAGLPLEIVYDSIAPTLSASPVNRSHGNKNVVFEWLISFSGADLIDLDESFVSLTGASDDCTINVSASGSNSRQLSLSNCSGNGEVQISILAQAASDLAGNTSLSLDLPSITVDNIAPTLTLSNPSPVSGTVDSTFRWTATYSGADTISLSEDDILLTGETDGCLKSVTGTGSTERKISVFNCNGVGLLSLTLASNTAQDLASNQALASDVKVVTLTNPISVGFAQVSSVVSKGTNTHTQSFEIKLNKAHPTPVTVGYALVPTFTTSSSHDLTNGTVTFAANQTSAVITYNYNGDTFNSGSKIIQLALQSVSDTAIHIKDQITRRLIREDNGPERKVVSLSTKHEHACAVLSNGQLKCWGHNLNGQLGDSTANNSSSPITVPGNNYATVSTGLDFTCAITSSGTLNCWGNNVSGQLGSGELASTSSPIEIGTDYQQVSAGRDFACGIKSNKDLYCWGANHTGQLGLGSGSSSTHRSPEKVGEDFIYISTAHEHACGIKSNKDLYCWGKNSEGQLGLGNKTLTRAPAFVASGYSQVSVGDTSTCGVKSNKDLYCWGTSSSGALGIGSNSESLIPALVESDYHSVDTANYHACGIKSSGLLKCWGSSSGLSLSTENTPRSISDQNFNNVATGFKNSCAIISSGDLSCWGANEGQGAFFEVSMSSASTIGSGFKSISGGTSGGYFSCAIKNSTNETWCWGSNNSGVLGNSSDLFKSFPVKLPMAFDSISHSSDRTACGITSTKDLYCWGNNQQGQFSVPQSTTWMQFSPFFIRSGVQSVSVGILHMCYIDLTNDLYCAGANWGGQLGTGNKTDSNTPILIGSNFQAVSAGGHTTCAIKTNGDLYCWGSNDRGNVGNGTTTDLLTATELIGTNFKFVRTSGTHTCGLKTSNSALYCWGSNSSGELGTGNTTPYLTPQLIGNNYLHVAIEESRMCAITTAGALKCWGSTFNQELSQSFGSGHSQVSLSYPNVCTLSTSGQIECWGINFYGSLGRGDLMGVPSPIVLF